MRPIDKFILHVVHNWKNELNEAYSEKAIQGFINKFKEEADDLNISITDEQLRAYINTFDRIKEKLPSDQRDLNKWNIGKLVRLVTSTKGAEAAEEMDITPDVVYHNDNNTIVIYNGSKENNCIRYGSGEKWCITRSSFPNYRYNETKGYPTFYLAKNNNLSNSNKLSFVAIQVRDPEMTRESGRYVYTNRNNSPYESDPMSFEELLSEVPWLRDIPNLKSILKYIPLSTGEKISQQYRSKSISYREWVKLPYSAKEQYLVIRVNRVELFSDVSAQTFVEKYLPKYPELAKFIAETPGIIEPAILLKNLDKFPNQIRRSITANIQEKLNTKNLSSENFPFDVKKLLTQLNKWDLRPNERIYVTKDGNTIVKLTLGDNIKIDLYQEEDDFPNIKLNKRTSKYLLDYPELDKIPLKNLLKLAENEIIDKDLIIKVLNTAKDDPNSAIMVKPIEDGNIILDSNSFSSYKVGKDGKITSIPFDNEEVQQVFNDAKDNEAFQQNALKLFTTEENIPDTIDKEALLSVIKSIPYNKRTVSARGDQLIVLTSDDENVPFFVMTKNPSPANNLRAYYLYGRPGGGRSWRMIDSNEALNDGMMKSYINYLRQINKSFNDAELLAILRSDSWGGGTKAKMAFIKNNPPLDTNNRYKVAMNGETALVIDTANPRNSFKVSDNSGKLIKANIPPSLARQLLGGQQAAAPATPAAAPAATGRRGRPAGVRNNPAAPAVPAAPAGGGDVNVAARMQELGLFIGNLPPADRRRLNVNNAESVNPNGDRGAARRNNILDGRGRVTQVLQIGASKIYIIRLNNQQVVASINVQPGNRNYVLTRNTVAALNSPTELLSALRQRGLAEIHNYLVNEYLSANPERLSEFRQLLRKHITEKNGTK